MKPEFSQNIFEQYLNTKLHENTSSGNWVVKCRRMDGQTDMTKLMITFRNVVNGPKNENYTWVN